MISVVKAVLTLWPCVFQNLIAAEVSQRYKVELISEWKSSDFGKIGVSLSVSGNKIAVGSPFLQNSMGTVMIIEKNSYGVYPAKQTFWGKASYSKFGQSILLLDDVLFVGAPHETCYYLNKPFQSCGVVYRFQKSINASGAELWEKFQMNNDFPEASAAFGSSIASSGDILAIGIPGHNTFSGRVLVYNKQDTGSNKWTATAGR